MTNTIKLGDTVEVTKMGNTTTHAWLVKDMSLKRFAEENNVSELKGKFYKVMGFIPGKGWYSANNGTLKEMREYIKSVM